MIASRQIESFTAFTSVTPSILYQHGLPLRVTLLSITSSITKKNAYEFGAEFGTNLGADFVADFGAGFGAELSYTDGQSEYLTNEST